MRSDALDYLLVGIGLLFQGIIVIVISVLALVIVLGVFGLAGNLVDLLLRIFVY